jgi:hypothetical protein
MGFTLLWQVVLVVQDDCRKFFAIGKQGAGNGLSPKGQLEAGAALEICLAIMDLPDTHKGSALEQLKQRTAVGVGTGNSCGF